MAQKPLSYHHGDLQQACLKAGLDILANEGIAALSLRAIAKKVGVSPGAPYRHYANKDDLISAIATIGYCELLNDLRAIHPQPATAEDIAQMISTYVAFACRNPALFHVMFGNAMTLYTEDVTARPDTRINSHNAMREIAQYLCSAVQHILPQYNNDKPDSDNRNKSEDLSRALWSLAHGYAMLILNGHFMLDNKETLAADVQASVLAILQVQI